MQSVLSLRVKSTLIDGNIYQKTVSVITYRHTDTHGDTHGET